MAMPHRLAHEGDGNDIRAVDVTTPSVMAEDEPLTPTMTKEMERRLQKIKNMGASGRRLVVGCDGMQSLAVSRDIISQIRTQGRILFPNIMLTSVDRYLGKQR
jgi:hypothetical protein